MNLESIPAFEDNYIWTVHDGKSALFVDPGEAEPILSWLEERRMQPVAILVTHHHGDHCGGLSDILTHYDIPVYGPTNERIRGISHPMSEGMACHIPELAADFTVMDIPGHTPGHIAYFGHGWLFCGDTLFSCGCGKVFGGTVPQLYHSLKRIAALPGETLACPAHEYTLENIRFALMIDPENIDLLTWQDEARRLRAQGLPTLPVRLDAELRCNPFLRCNHVEIQRRFAGANGIEPNDEAATFAALRAARDTFR